MKRLLPVLLAVFAIPAMGQKSKPGLRTMVQNQLRTESTVNYLFSQSTATYVSLTGATDINGGAVWDDPDVRIEIPFTFWLNGITPDSLDFYFSFGSSLGAYDYSNLNLMGIISPFETDVIDRGTVGGTTQSTIQYKVDGTAPNRILKIEWKNVGNYDEWDNLGTTNDFANFQVWLYETTNKVEYRFGSSTINNPQFWFYGAPGAPVGIGNLDGMGDLSDAHFLRGAPANPMMVDSLDYLNGFPASGTVYTFSQLTVGLDEDQVVDLQVYPNPASDRVQVQSEMPISEFRILDISGREVLSGEVVNSTIELPSLSSGAYLLQLGHQGKWVNRRLMIE